jgi:membrane associated rhomboid family serine protease
MALTLLCVTVVVSLAGLWFAPWIIERSLLRPYWLLRQRQYWSLLGNALVHADLAHLLFNAFTFAAFAFRLEAAIGPARLLSLYACGIAASDAGTWFRYRADPAYASLGASGAILAVLFAALVYYPRESLFILPIPVPIPAPLFAVGYLLYSFFLARHPRGNINHQAHFNGAWVGLLFVALTDPPAWQRALHSLLSR